MSKRPKATPRATIQVARPSTKTPASLSRVVERALRARPLLSACMIVKDEEKALPECFESLHRLVDEVVVYDTGSKDRTVALARKAGARVVLGYWDDDFGRARNAALAECKGEWVLWIDADERFRCPNLRQMRAALEGGISGDALSVEIFNLGDDPELASTNIHRALRIFRRERCRWYGQIHEQVDLHPTLDGRVQVVPLQGAHIDHIGYQSAVVEERDKLTRNLRLAEAAVARGVELRGQEGVAELNLARALAALSRFSEAQECFDKAVALAAPGVTQRASLLFCTQNLVHVGRLADAVAHAQRLRDLCQQKGLANYLEAVALRRLGRPAEAVDLLEQIDEVSTEDGFIFPDALLKAELAGALCDVGRLGEAADTLALLIEEYPDVPTMRTALSVFAATGKSFEDLVAAMPESRLDRLAAALLIVPPLVADPAAEQMFRRFGPKPPVLAAAIRFAPLLSTPRALEWSARLRAIGMDSSCPLLAQARLEVLEVPSRVRAAVTAHAAFGDERGCELALALAPGLHEQDIRGTLREVGVLDPVLAPHFFDAVARPGAEGAGPVGSEAVRQEAVRQALADMGVPHFAQSANEEPATPLPGGPDAQLARVGADR